MKFGTAIIIFFVAIIAFIAELILYMIFGIGSLFSGSTSSIAGTVFFFLTLMILTVATAILAPICSVFELIINKILDIKKLKSKQQNKFQELFLADIGTSVLVVLLTLILMMMIVFSFFGMKQIV